MLSTYLLRLRADSEPTYSLKKNRPDTVQQPYSLVQNSFLSSLMANGTMFYQGNQLTLTQFSLEAYLLQPTAEWLKLLESLNFSSEQPSPPSSLLSHIGNEN